MPANPAIELENVTVVRDGNVILDGVTATAPENSVTAVIGPNGAGKTTLLRALLGLIPCQGRVAVRGRGGGPARIGYVPQRLDFDRAAPITVLDFLVMPRQRAPVWFGIRRRYEEQARRSLKRVQADHLIGRPLGRLSGGELQRVQLALALQIDPDVLLLDEPVSGADVVGEKLFCDLLEQIQRESRLTMLWVSHDLSVVSRHASHVWCLNKRMQCFGPTPSMLTAENIARIYGPHSGLYEHHDAPGSSHTAGHGHGCDHDHGHDPGDDHDRRSLSPEA